MKYLSFKRIHVATLDKIWGPFREKAADLDLSGYGVLVARDPESGFMVVVLKDSPEQMYTISRCSGSYDQNGK